MNKYFLKFLTEGAAKTALANYMSEGEFVLASHSHALDPVGILRHIDISIVNGEEVVKVTLTAGYHVNLALVGAIPPTLALYVIHPASPSRVWA